MSADKLLTVLFNAGIGVSIIATVMSLGMAFTVADVVAPLRRWVLVVLLVVLNCLLIPAAAWGLFSVFGIKPAYVIGGTLAAIGAAGPSGLKAAQLARHAHLPLAVSVVIVMQLVNLVAVPLWAGQVVTGASISAVTILKNLLELVLLPLAIGLLIRWRYADHATSWQPGLVKLANLALGLALVAGLAVNWSTIVSMFGSRVLLASLVVVLVALAAGALVGGRDGPARTSTGLVSGMRFCSLGLIIIGTQLHGNPSYLGPAIVFALVDTFVVIFLAVELGRRKPATAASTAPSGRKHRGGFRRGCQPARFAARSPGGIDACLGGGDPEARC